MISNRNMVFRWVNDQGDSTHIINYDINENSVVMDLGGFTGVWAQQMINKYNPNIYIIEPITKFHDMMVSKFSGNNKINILNVGISDEDKDGVIYMNDDGTSSNLVGGESVNVKFNSMETILNKWGLESVDLLQINIEGDEYHILENMIQTGIINKFKNIQIQFHLGIDDCVNRRELIRGGLKNNGFEIKFDYTFVWESWTKIKN